MKKKISRRDFISKSALGIGFVSINAKNGTNVRTLKKMSGEMSKRKLGRTGRMVSCIGFGGGSRYASWVPNEGDAEKLIDYAIKLGITYFDAARSYGGGKTEERYGRYLTPRYRSRIFLTSKTAKRTYDGVMEDIEISLKTLKTDYLDLYCMHGIDRIEDVKTLLSSSGGYKAFVKLKDEGAVQNIGFSYHKWNEASKESFEKFDVDAVLCPLNASRYSGNEVNFLPLALERDVGVIAIKTTGQNALLGNGNVTGTDLVRYALSLPISLASVGIDGYATLESCAEIGREPVISREEAEKIHKKLDFDPKVIRLPYFQG